MALESDNEDLAVTGAPDEAEALGRAFAGLDSARLRSLAEKYDRPGPRYTSYPTAVQFSESFGESDYRERLRRAADRKGEPLSVYAHIPFCEHRCDYCGCYVIPTQRREVAQKYVDYLGREIDLVADELGDARPLRVLHLGGGTPTYLDPDELSALMASLSGRFAFERDADLSVEVDPRVTSREQLETLRGLGFRRVSLGVQDVSPTVQRRIGRDQKHEETVECFEIVRELGFSGVNVDLVYGLPAQTPESLARTVQEIIRLRPDRVAIYGYAHVPWIRSNQRSIPAESLPKGVERLELFLAGARAFMDAGYVSIGMDHFALPGDELVIAQRAGRLGRNFMGYSPHAHLEIVGLGCSSIGFVADAFAQNQKKLAPYYQSLDRGELPVERGSTTTSEDALRRWTIHRILCDFRLEASRFRERFGEELWEHFEPERRALEPLMGDGLVCFRDDDLEISPPGRLFVRNIAMVFDAYLQKPESSGRSFSQTV